MSPTTAEPIVQVCNLTMRFGKKEAVKRINFSVSRGAVHGFIGPNGAGKTTTIRILATLQLPTEGCFWIAGENGLVEPRKARQKIGYMPDFVGVYNGLTVAEYLDFFALAYRIHGPRRKTLLDSVVELTDLGDLLEVEVQVLSKGMRQRLCLAQTLLHDPEILILDEPASGLDPRARIEFRALLRELQQMGKTVFLSSHILTELSSICDSVSIIEQGEIVADGRIDDIMARLAGSGISFQVRVSSRPEDALAIFDAAPDVSRTRVDGNVVKFRFSGDEQRLHELWAPISSAGISIVTIRREEEDLEHIFMKLTRGEVS
ncbi:MAG TPA: ABC transporter ATP-binding protein [Planctomycetes bacterium]|nr:ABC transporter ATP-binding protein [Planctomycetota bacterium]HIN80593.1 ABC transporter ATP-binding protein [Planctomycetota bacterium]